MAILICSDSFNALVQHNIRTHDIRAEKAGLAEGDVSDVDLETFDFVGSK